MTTTISEPAPPEVTCGAAVFFPGGGPPTLDDLRVVERAGVRIEMLPAADGDRFAARLRHPAWGEAFVCSPRPSVAPVAADVVVAPWLTRREKERLLACRQSLLVACMPPRSDASGAQGGTDPDPVVERKRLFRFARALCGDRAAGILDAASTRYWSIAALDEELDHDAPLDPESLYLVHAITDAAETFPATPPGRPPRITWFHTHGLAEAGAFDIDILLPSRSILSCWGDPLRGFAALALDGCIEPDMDCYPLGTPGGDVAFVPADRWEREASVKERLLRQDGGDHRTQRVVICDPLAGGRGGARGAAGAARPAGTVRYSRFLANVDVGEATFSMSSLQAARAAVRARETLPRLGATLREFGPFVRETWLMLELDTEDGSGGKERLSFVLDPAEDCTGSTVRAVLIDTPRRVGSLRPGDAGRWPVERIAEWRVDTVVGPVSPRSGAAARILREERERLLPLLRAEEQRRAGRGRTGAASFGRN